MPGNANSGNRSPNRAKVGRPPQSITLRIGDAVAYQERAADGAPTPLALGTVASIERGDPRKVRIALNDGVTVVLFVSKP